MKNQQPPVAVSRGDGQSLEVTEIFSTIQGEGLFSGAAAVFVRLAGCNLQCPLCDTIYPTNATMHVDDILRGIRQANNGERPSLVVLTGGEPFRQPLGVFLTMCVVNGLNVQIETNGKLPIQDKDTIRGLIKLGLVTIILSPKTTNVNPLCAELASAFKYVVQHGQTAEDGLPITALGHPVKPGTTVARPPKDYAGVVFVHPADEQDPELNRLNLTAATNAILNHPDKGNRRLGLQVHKILELP